MAPEMKILCKQSWVMGDVGWLVVGGCEGVPK